MSDEEQLNILVENYMMAIMDTLENTIPKDMKFHQLSIITNILLACLQKIAVLHLKQEGQQKFIDNMVNMLEESFKINNEIRLKYEQ